MLKELNALSNIEYTQLAQAIHSHPTIKGYLDYLSSNKNIDIDNEAVLPSDIVPIDLSQLQKETSLQTHLQLSNQGQLTEINSAQQTFIQQSIQHSIKGGYTKERIQNTMDAKGNHIQISYKKVQFKNDNHSQNSYLCERVEDNSTAPETLVHLLIPHYSSKRKGQDWIGQPASEFIGCFGNGSMTYLDDADKVIYTVMHPVESCQIYVENGQIKGYRPLDYEGHTSLVIERLTKVQNDMEAELQKTESIMNWRFHAQGINEKKCQIVLLDKQQEEILNQPYLCLADSQHLFPDETDIQVKIYRNIHTDHTLRTSGIRIEDINGLYINTVYPDTSHYDKLFDFVPQKWRDIMHREGLIFQIKAPLIRDRTFFSWGHASPKKNIQVQIASTLLSYYAQSFREDKNFVIPDLPEDLMMVPRYNMNLDTHLFPLEDQDFLNIYTMSLVFKNLKQYEGAKLQVLLRIPFIMNTGRTTTLLHERQRVFLKQIDENCSDRSFSEWTSACELIAQAHRQQEEFNLLQHSIQGTGERYQLFKTLLSRLSHPIELKVIQKDVSFMGKWDIFNQILSIHSSLFDENKHTLFEAWKIMCHELTHYFEHYEKIYVNGYFFLAQLSCHCQQGTETHQRDGHFTSIYRLVSAELYRQLKLLLLENSCLSPEVNFTLETTDPLHTLQLISSSNGCHLLCSA